MDIKDNINNGNGYEDVKVEPKGIFETEAYPFRIRRYFTFEGKDSFKYDIYGNPIQWVSEEVKVSDDMGKVIFVQPDVKRPSFWSSLALKVVASKYFWGDQAKGQRENS